VDAGVFYDNTHKKPWRAKLNIGRKKKLYLGSYDTEEEASIAYQKALERYSSRLPDGQADGGEGGVDEEGWTVQFGKDTTDEDMAQPPQAASSNAASSNGNICGHAMARLGGGDKGG